MKGLFVPSNLIDGIPFSGKAEQWLTFDDDQELNEFIGLSFKVPKRRPLEFQEINDECDGDEESDEDEEKQITLKRIRTECKSYVCDGDAQFYNDNAQSLFIETKAKEWIGDDDCIFGNVLFLLD